MEQDDLKDPAQSMLSRSLAHYLRTAIVLMLLGYLVLSRFTADAPEGLTPEARASAEEIIERVMADESEPTLSTRKEFWGILDDGGGISDEELDELSSHFDSLVQYRIMFYEDLRIAVDRGEPYMSVERRRLEEQLEFPQEAKAQWDEVMQTAAAEGVIIVDGEEVQLNDPVIDYILDFQLGAQERMRRLYQRPRPSG